MPRRRNPPASQPQQETLSHVEQFEKECNDQAAALGKHWILIEQPAQDENDSEEEEDELLPWRRDPIPEEKQPSMEMLRSLAKIFVPKIAVDRLNEIVERLQMVGADEEDLKLMREGGFIGRFTVTSSSYEGHAILAEYLKKAEHAVKATPSDLKDAFHWALAITYCFKNDDFWYTDTDDPETVEKLVARILALWRKLLKASDTELDITPADRAAVRKLLEGFKEGLERWEYKVGRLPH